MSQASRPDAVHEIFYNTSFIVFNYDRCLEHFLEFALRAFYGLERPAAARFVKTAPIIHPYGKIGELEQLPFGGEKDREFDLLPLAKQIRTYSERFEESSVLEDIRKEVTDAACIVYLGFSFLEQNMNLLRPRDKMDRKPVFGTAYGLSSHDRAVVTEEILRIFNDAHYEIASRSNLVDLDDIKCAQLFDTYARSLNVA